MNVEILERNIQSGIAKIRFSHNNVVHTSIYDLKLVVPGTERNLNEQNLVFDEARQQIVIDKLTNQIQREIESGILFNPI
jgi:hypothetical protein